MSSSNRIREIVLPANAKAAPDVDLASRMPQFIGIQGNPGTKLRKLRLAVIGAGSIGARLCLHLARQQVDTLIICDRSRFKKESLLTQPILPEAIGAWKAEYIGRLCKLISPRTRVLIHCGRFEELETFALADVDVVLMASDNLALESAVGQACKNLGKTLCHASLHGETLVAQVRVFGNTFDSSPCPACLFGAEEWRAVHEQTAFKCELSEDGQPIQEMTVAPTVSVSFLCSMAADLAMTQLFRHVLKLGQAVTDTLLEYSGFTHRTTVSPFKQNPDCLCDHQVWQRMQAPRALDECSLSELADAAGVASPAFMIDELSFVESASCGCGERAPVQRFVDLKHGIGSCPRCGKGLHPETFKTHRSVSGKIASQVAHRPVREIGGANARWVVVRDDDRAVLLSAYVPSPLAGEG